MTGTFLQPDHTSQDGSTYKLAINNSIAVLAEMAATFAPHEQDTPDMTVRVDAGRLLLTDLTLVIKAAQNTATITAPSVNPRIDRVVIDQVTGIVSVVTGVEAASPEPPAIPADKFPICQVALTTSTTAITNDEITDERVPFVLPPVSETFPVNSIYKNSGGDPATELGYGTWQEVESAISLPNLRLLLPWGGITGDKPTPAATGQTVTYNGGAAVSTVALKYGAASLLLDGNGDYVSLAAAAAWQFGTADFAILLHVKLIAIQQSGSIVTIRNTILSIGGSDNLDGLQFYYASDGGANDKLTIRTYSTLWLASDADVLSDLDWHEILVTRLNSRIYLFLDGALVGSAACTKDFATARNLYLGVDPSYIAANRDLDGYIGRVRIYNGVGGGPVTWPDAKQYHWKRTA